MHDPKRFEARFQGRDNPREGGEEISHQDEATLGDLCLSVGNVTDALAYYRSALARITSGRPAARVEVALKVSACLRRQGKVQEAMSFVETVIESFTGRHKRDLLAEKATLLCLLGRYGEAAEVCDEALCAEAGCDRERDASIYLVLGHVLSRLCKWKQAIICLEQAATFGRMCGDTKVLGNALNNLGIVYKNLCRFGDSARFLRKAVGAARQMGDNASLSTRLLNLANTLIKKGDIEHADVAISECIKITSALNIARTRILAQICKARAGRARGDLDVAMQAAESAAAEAKTLDDPRMRAVAEETVAELLAAKGDALRARNLLTACLKRLPAEARDVEAEVRSRLAEVLLDLGKEEDARRHAEEAARIAEDIGDLFEAGRSFRVLALITAPGPDSVAYLDKAERIFGRIGARLEMGLTLLVGSQIREGDGPAAARYLKKAILAFKACGARGWHLRALCGLGVTYASMLQHEQAMTCLDEAGIISVGDAEESNIISEARSKIDSCLADRLSPKPCEKPESVQAAFAMLAARLGISGMCLARRQGVRRDQIVRSQGMTDRAAAELVRVVSAREGNPIVLTDVADLIGRPGLRDRLRSLLAVRLGKDGSQGLFIVCWRDKHGPRGEPGPGTSLFVRAYYEINRVLPILEKAVCPPVEGGKAICVWGMVTTDSRLKEILLALPRIADGTANVLIMGETGTGKELVARAIHALSRRRDGPFVAQNCAALPEHLLESELFGHKAGAFTGARADKRGLLEVASGGTFFLDEVGDVSPSIQAKMLRVIESGEIRRVGDTVTRPIDARFLTATNKNLEDEVERGTFRRDLYYRLNVVSVCLPPLRDRRRDIEVLTHLFLKRFAGRMGKVVKAVSDDAMRMLATYEWPGNVRQLENEIERAVTLAKAGEVIGVDTLSPCLTGGRNENWRGSLKDEIRTVERRRIVAALRRCGWNKTHAARILGDISRPALIGKMKRLGIPLKPG